MIDYTPVDGDESYFGYNITYTDDSGEKYHTWIEFLRPYQNGSEWTLDSDIYDRGDERSEAARAYCE